MSDAGRILVIDDNDAIHEDFRKIFSNGTPKPLTAAEAVFFGKSSPSSPEPQYELEFASQGEQGLALVEKAINEGRPHCLAFVDMRMPPGWDGIQTIRRLWEVHPGLQVVICSAYSDYSWKEIVENLGVSDRLLIIKKPFDNMEVLQAAAALNAKRALEIENRAYRTQLESKVVQTSESLRDSLDQLTESTEILQSSLDAMTASVAILDGSGNLLFRNDAWAKGESPLVAGIRTTGQNYLRFCESFEGELQDTASELKTGIESILNSNDPPLLLEYQCHEQDQAPSFTARVSRFQSDGPARVVVLHEDISDYKQLQAKLVQALKLESMGQLSAGIAHEINSPMQYIGDNIDSLKESIDEVFALSTASDSNEARLGKLKASISASIDDCQDGFDRVTTIIRAMKELSHPGKSNKEHVELPRLIESAKTITRNRWKYHANLLLDLPDALPPAFGYAAELNQVFLNMIVNASDAIADKFGEQDQLGEIRIAAREIENEIEISIADNGAGIPQKIVGRVFDPFFTTKDVGKGTGQGLAICYDVIVNKHGGKLDVMSKHGEGTCFTIRVPKFQPEKSVRTLQDEMGDLEGSSLSQFDLQDVIG